MLVPICGLFETGIIQASGFSAGMICRIIAKNGLLSVRGFLMCILSCWHGKIDLRGVFRNATGFSVAGNVSGHGSGAFQAPLKGTLGVIRDGCGAG